MGPFDDLTPVQREQIRDAHARRKAAARGNCSECGANIQLKKDGTLWAHGTQGAVPGRLMNCTGSSQPPKAG